MSIKIEKGIALPSGGQKHGDLLEAMKTMKIGESFLYRAKYYLFGSYANRAQIKITFRLIEKGTNGELNQYRVWRIK